MYRHPEFSERGNFEPINNGFATNSTGKTIWSFLSLRFVEYYTPPPIFSTYFSIDFHRSTRVPRARIIIKL